MASLAPTPREHERRRRRLVRKVRAVTRRYRELTTRYGQDEQLRQWFVLALTYYCGAICSSYSSEKARSKWASRYENPAGVLESAP